MKEQIEKVKEFNKSFGVEISERPCLIPKEEYTLRYNLAEEELKEYKVACESSNLVEVADALGDQLYILLGTMLKHGLHDKMEQVFNEIHESNMSKLGEDGKPIYRHDGKVLKGPSYFKPNLKQFF